MFDLWVFEQLSPQERQHLEELTIKRTYEKGAILFLEGAPASTVLLITAGRVKLFKVSSEGKEVILGFLGSHDLLGEEMLFREGVRSFSAQAVERTTACVCTKEGFESLATRLPVISAKITRTLGEKLSQMSDQLADIAMYDVRNRLIRLLARLACEQGESTHLGLTLDQHITHEDLGALVGASRVMVSNVLLDLRESGLLQMDTQRRFIVSQTLLDQAVLLIETEPAMTESCACFRKLLTPGGQ
jgi:CRP-like cAMP-binding protein